MIYTLLYTQSAFDDIQKLDTVVRKRIKKKIELFAQDPLVYAKRLTNPTIGSYRWRAGNYRIVFDIDKNRIVILRVGHRSEIYK